ncbi:MAG: hypothetical protein QOE92_290 [Chloroflexota bacterium]|jgi:PhnB protein|nr:hypothetical protein [Chloroflexota bacterium]
MADSYPAVIPMIAYEDGPAAMDWLVRAFGFRERTRMVDGGRLSHGELETEGGGVVMLATPTPAYQSPRRHCEECEAARRWSEVPYVIDGALVYVDDVVAHHARAVDNGATVLSGVEADEHGRRYRAQDPEGHRWMFMERPPEGA